MILFGALAGEGTVSVRLTTAAVLVTAIWTGTSIGAGILRASED